MKALLALQCVAIAVLVGVMIWAHGDFQHRQQYVYLFQIPPIAMMLIRRLLFR